MQIPANYHRVEGSERHPAREALLVGPADPNEKLSVTIRVRRRPDGPAVPDMSHWANEPPGRRRFLTREQAAAQYGASQQDLDKVVAFAQLHGLNIVESNAARRSVVVSGTVAQMENAFAVTLGRYRSPNGTYRGREGYVYLPADLGEVVRSEEHTSELQSLRHLVCRL